jgi:hypothetical protein
MDYKNGKIYKITSDSCDKIYIGSTCQPLYKRFGEHKGNYKHYLKNNIPNKNITSFEIIKLGNAIITLIEDFPCERKEQLHARERYYIELNKDICINKYIPTRTDKEYCNDNKEKIAERKKEYRQKNINLILENDKKYKQLNKEKLKEIRKQHRECICGSYICIYGKGRHEKTKKHLAFIQSQS